MCGPAPMGVHLVADRGIAHDRPCDQVWEHQDIGGELDQARLGFHLASGHVGQIADQLESEERDAQWQGDLDLGDRVPGQKQIEVRSQEPAIFENRQDPEVQGYDSSDQNPALTVGRHPIQSQSTQIVRAHQGREQEDIAAFAPHIECHTARQQGPRPPAADIVTQQENRQKVEDENDGAEDHAARSAPRRFCFRDPSASELIQPIGGMEGPHRQLRIG